MARRDVVVHGTLKTAVPGGRSRIKLVLEEHEPESGIRRAGYREQVEFLHELHHVGIRRKEFFEQGTEDP